MRPPCRRRRFCLTFGPDARTSVTLSANDVGQLQAALKTLLSPLDFESIEAWRAETRKTVGALVQPDTSVSFLPLDGANSFQSDRLPALAEYADHFHTMDPTHDYRSPGTQAFIWPTWRARCERPSREAWLGSEFYNDWVRPQALCQPCGLTVVRSPDRLPFPPVEEFSGVAGLWFYWDREEPCVAGERELAILQMLLPAFECGIQLAVRSVQTRDLVEDILGNLAEGVALVDEAGRVAHESPAFRQLLADEPEAVRVEAECTRIGRLVLAYVVRQGAKSRSQEILEATEREVRTARATYRVRSALVGPHRLGPHLLAIVLLERVGLTRLSLAYLHERYHMTEREAAVSRFLADGHSNAEVARLLGISIHTARRHVEHVLMKLGVHSRAAVGAKLRELDDPQRRVS